MIAFQLSELDILDCLRKQPCLALLTLAGHRHETACGILQFNTPMMNSAEEV